HRWRGKKRASRPDRPPARTQGSRELRYEREVHRKSAIARRARQRRLSVEWTWRHGDPAHWWIPRQRDRRLTSHGLQLGPLSPVPPEVSDLEPRAQSLVSDRPEYRRGRLRQKPDRRGSGEGTDEELGSEGDPAGARFRLEDRDECEAHRCCPHGADPGGT